MTAEGSGTIRSRIKNLLRSPSIKLRRRSGHARHKEDRGDKANTHTHAHAQSMSAHDILVLKHDHHEGLFSSNVHPRFKYSFRARTCTRTVRLQ